ncbi:hypothetical protein FACS1894216_09960 [Synergistales bacterium]|nr:hypothetical protein FACS1894216_09960 [Synergistales bacterium]
MKVCDRCGNVVSWNKPFCPLCGNYKLKDVESPQEPGTTPAVQQPAEPNETQPLPSVSASPASLPAAPEARGEAKLEEKAGQTDLPGLPVVDRVSADPAPKRDRSAPIFALDEEDLASAPAPPSLGEGISTHRTTAAIEIKPGASGQSDNFSQFQRTRLTAPPTAEVRAVPGIDLTRSPQPARALTPNDAPPENSPAAPPYKIPGLEYLNDMREEAAPPEPVRQPAVPPPKQDAAPVPPVSRIPGLEYLNDDEPEKKTPSPAKAEPPAEATAVRIPGLDYLNDDAPPAHGETQPPDEIRGAGYIEPETPPELPINEPAARSELNTVICPACGEVIELRVGTDGKISIVEGDVRTAPESAAERNTENGSEPRPAREDYIPPMAPAVPVYKEPQPPVIPAVNPEPPEDARDQPRKTPEKDDAPYLEGEFLKMFPEAKGGR